MFRRRKSSAECQKSISLMNLRKGKSENIDLGKRANGIPRKSPRDSGNQSLSLSDSLDTVGELMDFGIAIQPNLTSSLSDVTSVGAKPVVVRDTATSRSRHELRRSQSQNQSQTSGDDADSYLTPLQRKDKELKELRKQCSKLSQGIEERDKRIHALRCAVDGEKRELEEEMDRRIEELQEQLRAREDVIERERTELTATKEELLDMDKRYMEVKKQMSDQEEKFEVYIHNVYSNGYEAARFEREEELEMLSKDRRASVSVDELSRKLSRTEMELAKWQSLRLNESYAGSQGSEATERPKGEAAVTLAFLKDAFFHFLCDSSDTNQHLRAIVNIFKYSEVQKAKILRALSDKKVLDAKKVLKKAASK